MRIPFSFLAFTSLALSTALGQPAAVDTIPFSEIPTNVFITDRSLGETIFYRDTSGRVVVPTNAVAAALKAPESGPSEDDPEGHWGPIVEGWQLSLRLSTNRFAPDQPVSGIVLLRNVTQREKEFTLVVTELEAFPVTWVSEVTGATTRIVALPSTGGLISPHHLRFHPRSQRRFREMQLQRLLGARGKFLVSVSTKVYEQGKDVEVSSGAVPVTLVGAAPE